MGSPRVDGTSSTTTTASTRAELENEKRKQAEENKKARENQALQQGLAGDDHLKAAVDRDFNKFCLIPPGEPLVNNMAAQGLFGTVISAPPTIRYATHGETRSAFNEAAKESLKDTKANWKDAVLLKSSEKYKNDQAYRKAVDDLFKRVAKLEKKADPKLYKKILADAQEALKSGNIEEVNMVSESAELAKKSKTLDAYDKAAREAANKTKEAAKTAEKGATNVTEEEAVKTAEKAAGKTAGKTGLKTIGKCVPYVGNVIFAGMEVAEDWNKLKAAKKKGGGAFAKQCVHTGVKTGAVIAGFALGMKAGAAIGSCIPIPVVGTVVGAVVGGVLGGAISWLLKKGAKAATKAVLGPEPGVEAQKQELASNPNNKYLDKNGAINKEMYLQSGDHEKLTRLAEYVQVNGTEGLSADTLKVMQYNGYLQTTDGQPPLDVAG